MQRPGVLRRVAALQAAAASLPQCLSRRTSTSHVNRPTLLPTLLPVLEVGPRQCRRCLAIAAASTTSAIPHYADLRLDRAGHLRKDAAQLQQLAESDAARAVLLHRYSGLLRPYQGASNGSTPPKWQPVILPLTDVPEDAIDASVGRVFLGLDEQQNAVFAFCLTDEGAQTLERSQAAQQAQWVELRREGGPNMAGPDAALVAYAAGLVAFARAHVTSSASGQPLAPRAGGHSRAAGEERAVFPRIDPAVIMAVAAGDWLLLGRQASWSPGRFSLLAGATPALFPGVKSPVKVPKECFCEVGETLEQAVVRETAEEAGVAVDLGSVRYHSSQPWPFPRSLMIGFTAAVASSQPMRSLQGQGAALAAERGISPEEIAEAVGSCPQPPQPDEEELQAAAWFHRSFLRDALAGRLPEGTQFNIPGPHALANRVITEWAQQPFCRSGEAWAGQAVPDAEIDGSGRFKYVLLRLRCPASGRSKLLVRGSAACGYHADVLEAAQAELGALGLQVQELGGGRIEWTGPQSLRVFGFSTAFGPAPHEISAALLLRRFPLAAVSTSYEGY